MQASNKPPLNQDNQLPQAGFKSNNKSNPQHNNQFNSKSNPQHNNQSNPQFSNQNSTQAGNQPNSQQPTNNQQPTDNQEPYQDENQEYFPYMQKPVQEELIHEWQAPSRPFKKRKRQYFTTIATIVLLLSLILFFAGQILPVAVVIAVAFLTYVMATIPPHTIKNSITTFGVRNEDDIYYWEELGRFWFDKKHNDNILYIEVGRFPFRLMILLGKEKKEDITEILSEVLIKEKPPLTETERLSAWLQKKVPLDIDS